MAAVDILGQASAAFPIWDGRSVLQPPYRSATNQTGANPPTLIRIINSYDGGTIANTELAQALVIGPRPVALIAGQTYACVFSALLLVDTSTGTGNVTISMPPDPYPGMVVTIKDTGNNAATYLIEATVSGSQKIQQPSSIITYSTSMDLDVNGASATWAWNAASTGPAASGAWTLVATVGY
jgi:hypothetical protein